MILSHGSIAHTRFRTCRTSSFCTVAWQLARFQLTRRIARSLGDSWASCAFSLHFVLSFFNWQQRAPHYGVVSECVSLVNWRRWSWWNSPREWDHSPQRMPSVPWHCWLGVMSIGPVQIEWWGVGAIICLERGADCLHVVQLMPVHPKTPLSLASFKSRLVLPFWYQLTIPRLSWKRGR